jgi:serine O-acetyltransferase
MPQKQALPDQIRAEVDSLVEGALPFINTAHIAAGVIRDTAASAIPVILEDLEALASRDTAAMSALGYVWDSYLSFRALLAYRVAHAVLGLADGEPSVAAPDSGIANAARRITEEAKARTGVDIHPAARIGRRMAIDHGWGTVVGEQASIGDDCYFLQNVTLGCRRIGRPYRADECRHPTIGNRVVLAGNVWVFGPVTIGDDCLVDPGARITTDIPAGAHVRVITKLQITQPARQLAPTRRHLP